MQFLDKFDVPVVFRDRHVQCCLCADRGDPTGAVLGYVDGVPVVVHVKVVDITVVAQRTIPIVRLTIEILQFFFDKVFVAPFVRVVQVFPSRSHARCVQRQVPWLRSAVAAHQQGRLHPVVAQSLILMAWQTIEIPLLPYTWWSMSLSSLCRDRFVQCQTVHFGLVIDMPVIVHVKVVDTSVVAQRPFPLVQLSRPLSSKFLGCRR